MKPTRGLAIIAEDSSANAAVLSIFVKQAGFSVQTFPDGQAAWDYISALSGEKLNELKVIFSDYMMPRMNGKELLFAVRAKAGFEKIPFVFCSAVADPEQVKEVIHLSQGYLQKPASLAVVMAKIESLFPSQP
jgi:CheY-like chemotaxis protein